jgi:hypothetical protein
MSNRFTESTLEETALEWLRDLGYSIVYGNDIAPDEPAPRPHAL